MKKMNLTLKCILVMSVIAIVSVALLAVANTFLVPAKSSGLNDKVIARLQTFCPADSYNDLTDTYADEIEKFNSENGDNYSKINGVYSAVGGDNDGNNIIEADGPGFQSGIITMLIAFNGETISGIGNRTYDTKNTYWKDHVEPNWDNVVNYFVGKSDLGSASGKDLNTGATLSSNGILKAVRLAIDFNKNINGNVQKPEPEEVTDSDILEKLKAMTNSETFIKYPYKVNQQVNCVYVDNTGSVIIDALGAEGSFGGCNLLVMVDASSKTVLKVTPIRMDYQVYGEYDASGLDDPDVLTNHFKGKNISDIDAMEKYLSPATGATESSTGLKNCIKNALKNIDGFLSSEWGSEVQTNE